MGLPADFPTDPYQIIDSQLRWYPGTDVVDANEIASLLPPFVAQIRQHVHKWREAGYQGASNTSRHLLNQWFGSEHLIPTADENTFSFRYYFAQREAVETAIWLYEVAQAHDPYSLMRYDSSGRVSAGMFYETWTRYVFKLATGAGKTKVLSLLIAWSYFHKRYEANSQLSRNFLLIAPNIIVLDRLRDDFDGLKIFHSDPVLPPNGYGGHNWQDDFQMTLHIQDEVGAVSESGNLFLTNVHRIYSGEIAATFEDDDTSDYFLGPKRVAKTTENQLDVSDVVRAVDDLVILNDEAHHIHDSTLAWFQSIQDIDAKMRQRTGHGIAAQLDVTATPKHDSGAIFVQTVCSYPLVEAIRQGVVKTPVVPDEVSRSKLHEHASDKIADRYADHIKLGYLEWKKRYEDLLQAGKKAVLFVMTTTTSESDEVAEYLERTFEDLTGRVLVIHTKSNGEINEGFGNKDELERLRKASSDIDSLDSPYVAVVSVMMLREGWDVQNVISMVGLRPYTAKSQVLPEQTLGRGLRRMFRSDPDFKEYVSVVGTDAFLDFVQSIQSEGVDLEKVPMGSSGNGPQQPLLVEVDNEDKEKDLAGLDISLPKLSSRIRREMRNLDDLNVDDLPKPGLKVKEYTEEEQREIVFRDLDKDETAWATDLGEPIVATQQAVLAYLSKELMTRLRLVGGQDVLYGKLKRYVRDNLFETQVDLDDTNVLRNLSEPLARRTLLDTFAEAINSLTVVDVGTTQKVNEIKLSNTRPTVVNNQPYATSKKTLFNKIVGDSNLELRFAHFLDKAADVQAFAKNTRAVGFFIEYVNSSGEISHYYPDFLVRDKEGVVWVVETKGLEDLDVIRKWKRLVLWCADATSAADSTTTYRPLFVTEEAFNDIEKKVSTFAGLAEVLADAAPTTPEQAV